MWLKPTFAFRLNFPTVLHLPSSGHLVCLTHGVDYSNVYLSERLANVRLSVVLEDYLESDETSFLRKCVGKGGLKL